MNRKIRCAIYTRKSSEDGLEQEFNSLHAQREACEAYILSQKAEGWVALATEYDDGGLSGGTLERPALQSVLADLDAGHIDQIVVYKIDRLSRSLADFAKIVDRLDAVEASFVSVTQSFNTATSMGRLTLNMLLSFAQFEREVTAERIRDKIAASKRKGLWMGGTVPLGYEPDGRSLIVNEAEAVTIRVLFSWYQEHGTVSAVKRKADAEGIVSKLRHMNDGRTTGGTALDRSHLHYILSNPTYAGKIRHKGHVFDGQHPAIIPPEQWQSVQDMLVGNAARERGTSNKAAPCPLVGKIFDETGDRLTPSHTRKGGKRVRYYISSRLVKGNRKTHPDAWRLPAPEFERSVAMAIRGMLSRPAAALGLVDGMDASQVAPLQQRFVDLARRFEAKSPLSKWAPLVKRIDITAGSLGLCLDKEAIAEGLDIRPDNLREEALSFNAPFQLRRKGVETKLVLGGVSEPTRDLVLLRNIAKAHQWSDRLKAGRSIAAIAEEFDTSPRRIQQVLPLAFLAPELVRQVLDGTQSYDLTSDKLVRSGVPSSWSEQLRRYKPRPTTCTA
ncbi:recombinase family protein [Litoreibacter janthinus]|uniref:Site-specific DNA recombinase n=1 Tax=Litoreibacter janthinus TaxID=670154 RepID=A0A1I6FRY3_9RHOB|nr:recombinase family protein [Litoreibacter janthinus]SFR32699.1 Site-specific DNA recombinase [Litoreibacter janthinus]